MPKKETDEGAWEWAERHYQILILLASPIVLALACAGYVGLNPESEAAQGFFENVRFILGVLQIFD